MVFNCISHPCKHVWSVVMPSGGNLFPHQQTVIDSHNLNRCDQLFRLVRHTVVIKPMAFACVATVQYIDH
eukprot:6174362-Pleurochrysis_carterae.AAC.2